MLLAAVARNLIKDLCLWFTHILLTSWTMYWLTDRLTDWLTDSLTIQQTVSQVCLIFLSSFRLTVSISIFSHQVDSSLLLSFTYLFVCLCWMFFFLVFSISYWVEVDWLLGHFNLHWISHNANSLAFWLKTLVKWHLDSAQEQSISSSFPFLLKVNPILFIMLKRSRKCRL